MQATLRVMLALSFIAGFADTATFIHLYGLFSAHVTGNFVLLAAAIGKGVHENDILKLLSFPVFVAAVALATLAHDKLRPAESEQTLDRWLARVAGTLLIVGAALALAFGRHGSPDDIPFADAAAGLIVVMAMGVQNAMHRFAAALGPPTTVMTGTVTQLTVMATRHAFGGLPQAKAPMPPFSLGSLFWLALAFAMGCLVSAPLTLVFGLFSLLMPGLLLLTIAV